MTTSWPRRLDRQRSTASFCLATLLFIGYLFPSTYGAPLFILENTAGKCIQLDVSQEMIITFEHYAPDLNFYNEEYKKESEKKKSDNKGRKNPVQPQDMSITIQFKEENKFGWAATDKTRRVKATGTVRSRQVLEEEKGTIQFYTGNKAGFLHICMQSFKATPSYPRRLGLNITKRGATLEEQTKNGPINEENKTTEKEKTMKITDARKSNSLLTSSSSHISIELEKMESKLIELFSNSDRSKDIEQEFHAKSLSLNKAVLYW
eukprot:CAMPEP_0198144238 /NCGR_PEP_ID=MMETSP1443-20131203/14325_1 /TAXON_ID=186043 /ORGANISM="Entomoneis sp., Strain CCMP2396" /LENGTH=262 /DNA_ID=CAMNT_0043807597 /DNA_START=105 /DNA_END=890 /DNA_ORIENTATION=-